MNRLLTDKGESIMWRKSEQRLVLVEEPSVGHAYFVPGNATMPKTRFDVNSLL